MDTTQVIRRAMSGYSIEQLNQLSETSGVPFRTLYKIKLGYTKDPKSSTIDSLASVLLPRRASNGKGAA